MNSDVVTLNALMLEGFIEEGRVREFYDEGEDKIIFWKKIQYISDGRS